MGRIVILEDLKKGQQIYVADISQDDMYVECRFHEILSDVESLVRYNSNNTDKFRVIRNSAIVLDEYKIEKIKEYMKIRNEYSIALKTIEELKESMYCLSKEM